MSLPGLSVFSALQIRARNPSSFTPPRRTVRPLGSVERLPRANAQTLMPTELYVMPSVEFDRLLAEDHAGPPCDHHAGQPGPLSWRQAQQSRHESVMSRLIKLLIFALCTTCCPMPRHGPSLPVRISQEQLASMTGSTQPTVSDLLQKLHKAGLIAIAHRQITIICNLAPPARPRRRNHRGLNTARKGWTGTLIHHDRFGQGAAIPTSSVH